MQYNYIYKCAVMMLKLIKRITKVFSPKCPCLDWKKKRENIYENLKLLKRFDDERFYLELKPMWNQSFSGYCQKSPLQYNPVCLVPNDLYHYC